MGPKPLGARKYLDSLLGLFRALVVGPLRHFLGVSDHNSTSTSICLVQNGPTEPPIASPPSTVRHSFRGSLWESVTRHRYPRFSTLVVSTSPDLFCVRELPHLTVTLSVNPRIRQGQLRPGAIESTPQDHEPETQSTARQRADQCACCQPPTRKSVGWV